MVGPPPHWYLVSHRHVCAIPHFATYRVITVRYPQKKQARKSGKKKAHKHKLFGPVALGTPQECPRDKPGLSPGQSGFVPGTNPGFFLFYTAEAQFVPGTNPVCPWDIPGTKGGRQSLCVKRLCAFFVPQKEFLRYTMATSIARDEKHRCWASKLKGGVPNFVLLTSGKLLVVHDQARKRHININFFVRLVFGFHRICPRDKPSLSQGQIR